VAKKSAGLLLFRQSTNGVEVLLAHPGGTFWAKKDAGAWSIPKGEIADDEEPLEAAKREFREETGIEAAGEFIPLTPLKQPSVKHVLAWAVRGDFDASKLVSNMFSLEWPPRSGKFQDFPEIDRAQWFDLATARVKILKGQAPFLDELTGKI